MNRYIVEVKNKNDTQFLSQLSQYGNIIHVSKLNNLILIESNDEIDEISKLSNVIYIRKTNKLRLELG